MQISEEECIKMGGHCWEDEDAIGLSLPPVYWRHCKHCGKRQMGRSQDNISWNDV